MEQEIAEALNGIAAALSTPPNSVAASGQFWQFAYTWQSYLVPLLVIFLGAFGLRFERLSQNLHHAEKTQMEQVGILRALRGEISTNIYKLLSLIQERPSTDQLKAFNLAQKVIDANAGRVGYQSARTFAMLSITYARINDVISQQITASDIREEDEQLLVQIGSLIVIAAFVDLAQDVRPHRGFLRAKIDNDKGAVLKTKLSDIPEATVQGYLSGFTVNERSILTRCYSLWKNPSEKCGESQSSDDDGGKPGAQTHGGGGSGRATAANMGAYDKPYP